MFVSIASDATGKLIPSVLGVVPSFVAVTTVDKEHPAVGISVNHTGDAVAVAATVTVSHSPFGVTDFTLHVIDPKRKKSESQASAQSKLLTTHSRMYRRGSADLINTSVCRRRTKNPPPYRE